MTNRRRNNAIALLLAGIAAALAVSYATGGSGKAAPSTRSVLVATHDISAGTPGSALLSQHCSRTAYSASSSRHPPLPAAP